jgi:hypothetical protein
MPAAAPAPRRFAMRLPRPLGIGVAAGVPIAFDLDGTFEMAT